MIGLGALLHGERKPQCNHNRCSTAMGTECLLVEPGCPEECENGLAELKLKPKIVRAFDSMGLLMPGEYCDSDQHALLIRKDSTRLHRFDRDLKTVVERVV